MSYERNPLIPQLGMQMSTVAGHLARARGAARKASEIAAQVRPELGAEVDAFFCDKLGLCRSVKAIGEYIGQIMWEPYDEEMRDAEQQGYGARGSVPGAHAVGLGCSRRGRAG